MGGNKRYTCECGKELGARYKDGHENTIQHVMLTRESLVGLRVKFGKVGTIVNEDDTFYYITYDGQFGCVSEDKRLCAPFAKYARLA